MNELTIGPSPKWYRACVVACAPDNTLVYIYRREIVILQPPETDNEVAKTDIIDSPINNLVISVALNKKWNDPDKLCVSCYEDNSVRVHDLKTLEEKFVNTAHQSQKGALLGAAFANDSRVISVSMNGVIVVWNINTNETTTIAKLFNNKDTVTCFAECPFETWRVAFGLQNGLVYVTDLRREGRVIYKLRGHSKSVVSVSWCPAPINIFPQSTKNVLKTKKIKPVSTETDKKSIWDNLSHADDGESTEKEKEMEEATLESDFLKECLDLKARILGEGDRIKDPLPPQEDINDNLSEEIPPGPINDNNIEENGEKTLKIDGDEEIRGDILEERSATPENGPTENSGRPLPSHYDPSCDIFDDLIPEASLEVKEKNDDGIPEKEIKEEDEDKIPENTAEIIKSVPRIVNEEEARDEYLIATSGIDKTVCIWRAGTNGTLQTMFRLTAKKKNISARHTWITTCWISPDTLLTSSDQSELLSWHLPKPIPASADSKKQIKPNKIVHNFNSGCLFNITAPIKYATKENWSEFKYDMRVWTNDMKGNLINYDMASRRVLYSVTALLSNVTILENSPIDPNRFAIGHKSGDIKLWDLSKPHTNNISLTQVHKLNGKITALVWHPTKENILAYGTEEGQVGFVDVTNQKAENFHAFFKSFIYKIEWGPVVNKSKDDLGLYAVGDGKIAIFDTKNKQEMPVELELPSKDDICRFSWKPDYKLLMLAVKDGSLIALSPSLEIIDTLYLNEKSAIHVNWHPEVNSERSGWFAASTSVGFSVYDCASIDQSEDGKAFKDKRLFETFVGHTRHVTDLRWSPFDGNLIVSVAGDGLAHVWDVSAGVALATITTTDLSSPSLVVAWSPLDPNLLLVGMFNTLKICNYTKHPPKVTKDFIAGRKEALKSIQKDEAKPVAQHRIKVEIKGEKNGKKVSRNCIIPVLYVSNDENLDIQVKHMKSLMGECSDEVKPDVLQLFGGREDVLSLLDANYNQHRKEAKHNFSDLISLWKGDVASCVKEAIEQNRVTPTIITLAPMVSPKLHQDACFAYAKKLSEEANCNHLEAATHFLACHKIEEAIDCLCSGHLYREALALAKCRLPQGSDTIDKVAVKWADYSADNGNYETAAYCYLSLKEYEQAAKILSRRNNVEFMTFAAELAGKAGNIKLQDSLIAKCAEFEVKPLPTRAELLLADLKGKDSNSTEPECSKGPECSKEAECSQGAQEAISGEE